MLLTTNYVIAELFEDLPQLGARALQLERTLFEAPSVILARNFTIADGVCELI